MPSLEALGKFKFSFADIAHEREDIASRKLPHADLPLPDTEAPPMDFSDRYDSAPSPDTDGAGPPIGGTDFDFGAFLDGLPSDTPAPDFDEPPSIDDLFEDLNAGSSDSEGQSLDSFLDSLTETAAAELPADTSPETDNEEELLSDDPLGGINDAGIEDAGIEDAGIEDAGIEDAGIEDAGIEDAGIEDAGISDAGIGDDFESESRPGTDDVSIDDLFSGIDNFTGTEEESEPESIPDSVPEDDFNIDGLEPLSDNLPAEDSGDLPSFDDFVLNSSEEPSLSDEDLQPGSQNIADSDLDFHGEHIDLGGETLDDFSGEPAALEEESLLDDDFMNGIEPASESLSEGSFDLPLDDFADAGLAGDSLAGDSLAGDDLADADFAELAENGLADDGFLSSESASDFDSPLPEFDIDLGGTGSDDADLSEFASDTIELGAEDAPVAETVNPIEEMTDEDFHIPGLEDIFEKTKTEVKVEQKPKFSLFKRKKAEEDAEEHKADEDIEEIQLSEDDLNKLLKTLSLYPLNLRVACEELIAEQVLLPQQLSKLIRLLVHGAHYKETAAFAEQLLGRQIVIPRSFEKMSGAAFEAEQSSFAYIFVHNFLPVLRVFAFIAVIAACVFYLGYRFIYIPLKAESLYKRGYERIFAGEYQRANELFHDAFVTHRKKNWFYRYAEGFRDQRRFMLAEAKYDELLRYYPRDKKGVLDYARLNTYYLLNYEKANNLLQKQLLDYSPDDIDGLLAAGDNFLLWADSDPSRFYNRYEDARFSYARLLELAGWQPSIVERMMKYFIRVDNLKEVIYLRSWFESSTRRQLSASSLAELGGYLLDKQLEEVRGVPNPYVENIESVRAMLLQAVRMEPTLPEPHYHLARYYNSLGNTYEERLTLENAIRAYDLADTETVQRRLDRVDTHFRYSNLLLNSREFFPAEEQLVKGIQLYEDFLSRNLIRATPQLGQLYAAKGDIEYFVKSGNMAAALNDYRAAEGFGYSPPEVQYRMGAAYYQLEDWGNSLDYLFRASRDLPLNRRLLYALGNAAYRRGDFYTAQGYYDRLLDILDSQRVRLPVLLPNDNLLFLELGERIMLAYNNAGVVYEALADQTGNREYRSIALGLYAESARAWDSITRDPQSMTRMRLTDNPAAPGINLGYLNANNALRPVPNFTPQIFPRIDMDVLEPSRWEELAGARSLQ